MANITITIPDAQLTRVVDAVAATQGYDSASGLTKAQFAKKAVIEFVKNCVKQYEATQAAETARQNAVSAVDSQIGIN